jgi:hypothetical protein
MLLSDCSARQKAATEEVDKAKAQLQELQVLCIGRFDFYVHRDCLNLVVQEQIRQHQLHQQTLQQDFSDTLSGHLVQLKNRVSQKVHGVI